MKKIAIRLEVFTGPGLARGPYTARPAGRQMGGDFSNRPGRQMRDDFSNGPGRHMRGDFSNGQAHERWFLERAGPGRQKEKWVF